MVRGVRKWHHQKECLRRKAESGLPVLLSEKTVEEGRESPGEKQAVPGLRGAVLLRQAETREDQRIREATGEKEHQKS